MAEIFRAPVIASLKRGPEKAKSFDPPNLLLSVLVATIPFSSIEMPRPARAALVHREFDPPNLSTSTLSAPLVALPEGKGISSVAAPAPLRAKQFDPPNLLLSTLVPTVPFFEPHWPQAARAKAKASAFDPPNLSLTTLVTTFPIQNFQWPALWPRLAKVSPFDPPNLLTSTLVPTRPFFEPLFPSAWPRQAKVSPFDPPNLILSTLAPIPVSACTEAVSGLMGDTAQMESGVMVISLPVQAVMSSAAGAASGLLLNDGVFVEAELC